MKIEHLATQFFFEDSDRDIYTVEVKSAKRGENIFRINRNGTFLGERQPRGCNASKSTALSQLKLFLKEIGE